MLSLTSVAQTLPGTFSPEHFLLPPESKVEASAGSVPVLLTSTMHLVVADAE